LACHGSWSGLYDRAARRTIIASGRPAAHPDRVSDDTTPPPDCAGAERFRAAIARFDEANAYDPNTEDDGAGPQPRELLYARRLTGWVLRLKPDAGEVLRLAARCQHLCRWMIPRSSQPMTRAGYLKWRTELKEFHAGQSGVILRDAGYDEAIVARVQALNLKRDYPADPDSRVLEDALCLMFLEHQFAGLATRTDEDKMVNALRKSWAKMTEQARAEALKLRFGEQEQRLLAKALAPEKGVA
jgi:hypothetical protein